MIGLARIQRKTPDQLRAMRVSGLATGRILGEVCKAAVAGVTTRELDQLAKDMIAEIGATSSFLGYGGHLGLPGFPGVTCISVNDRVVHGIPDDYILADGDLVSIDFGIKIGGWHGDTARTVEIGAVSAEKHELNVATYDALWAGIAAVFDGGRIGDIGAAIEASLDKRWSIVRDYTGHGIGTEMHMDPDVPNVGRRGRGPKLSAGMCLAIEPIAVAGRPETDELDDDWTIVTVDGKAAAHWEHTVAVMPGGVWVLTAEDGGEAELAARGVRFAPLADQEVHW